MSQESPCKVGQLDFLALVSSDLMVVGALPVVIQLGRKLYNMKLYSRPLHGLKSQPSSVTLGRYCRRRRRFCWRYTSRRERSYLGTFGVWAVVHGIREKGDVLPYPMNDSPYTKCTKVTSFAPARVSRAGAKEVTLVHLVYGLSFMG